MDSWFGGTSLVDICYHSLYFILTYSSWNSMIIFMVATSSLFYEQSSKKTRIVTGVILLSITILVLLVVNLDHPGSNFESQPKSEFSNHVKRRELPPYKEEPGTPLSQSPLRDFTPLVPIASPLSSSIPRTPERIFNLPPRCEQLPPHVTRLDRSIVPIPSILLDEQSRSRVWVDIRVLFCFCILYFLILLFVGLYTVRIIITTTIARAIHTLVSLSRTSFFLWGLVFSVSCVQVLSS